MFTRAMRHFPRRAADHAIHWRVRGTALHRISRTVDVCPSGVFVETMSPSLEGTALVMRVPALGNAEIPGVVVRRSERGMGIALLQPLAVS